MSKTFNRYSLTIPVVTLGALILLASEPVAASHPVPLQATDPGFLCNESGNATFFGEVISNILSFLFVTGVPVFIVLYQLDGIMEFFALGAETKSKIKKHQRNLWMGAAKIYLIPVFGKILAIDVLGVINSGCITLNPF